MEDLVRISRSLGNSGRVRVLEALRGRELCVCQIIELLGLAPSTVSRHMAVLKGAGLVQSRKDGRWVYYRQADESAVLPVRQSLAWLGMHLSSEAQIKQDRDRLKAILDMDREELCRQQSGK